MCDPGFAAIYGVSDASSRFAYNVYQLWIKSYAVALQYDIPDLETQVYGRMASHVNYRETPFATENKNNDAYECVEFTNARIGESKLPLYDMTLSRAIHNIQVLVDSTIVRSPESTLATSQSIDSDFNLTLGESDTAVRVSTTSVVSDTYQRVLPAQFYRVGEWPSSPDGAVVYDVPFEEISSSGVPNARAGKVNYIFQGAFWPDVTPDSPITLAQWRAYNQAEFDANALGGSAATYSRRVVDLGFGRATCTSAIFPNGTDGPSVGNRDFCTILRYYRILPVDAEQKQIMFIPKSYNYYATIETPGGTFIQTQTSRCPDAYEVISTNGDVTIKLNTSSTSYESVFVQVHDATEGVNAACVLHAQSGSFKSSNPLFVGPITRVVSCPELYFNAKPTETGEWCYMRPGIRLDVSHAVFVGPGQPGTSTIIQTQIQDMTMNDILRAFLYATDLSFQITQIANTPYLTTTQIIQQIQDITDHRIQSLGNLSNANIGNQGSINAILDTIRNQSTTIAANIAANREAEQQVYALIAQMVANTTAAEALFSVMLQTVSDINRDNNITQAFAGILHASIRRFLLSGGGGAGHGSCPLGGIPIISTVVCGIWHAFGSLFGGIIGLLVKIVVGIIIAIILFKCLGACCSQLSKRGVDTVAGSDRKPMTNAHVELETVEPYDSMFDD